MNTDSHSGTGSRKIVLLVTAALLVFWLATNIRELTSDQESIIRLVLGLFFFLIVLFRPPQPDIGSAEPRGKSDPVRPLFAYPWLIPGAAVAGMLLVPIGLVFDARQFAWLGLLLILFACLRWSFPARYAPNIVLSLFLLYWIHPLPGRITTSAQIALQRLSVYGSEWFLHILNVRVWADGVILQTGTASYLVPEACSGMTTAVTVLLSALGAAIFFRVSVRGTVLLLIASVLQVLALNVLRISAMVHLAPQYPPEWSDNILHDTLGVFLLFAVAITQVEAMLAGESAARRRRHKQAIERGDADRADKISALPPFWQALSRWKWALLATVVIGVGLAGAVYKRRPYHRSEMIRGLLNDLILTDSELAQRAALAALELNRENSELRAQLARILLLRGKPEEALAELDRIPLDKRTTFQTVLRAWAFMLQGEPEDALSLVAGLPEDSRNLPDVSMILAEFAATRDNVATVVAHIVRSADSRLLLERVRRLFPYLASREQWKVIAECDRPMPYGNVDHALAAITAYLRTGETPRAGYALRVAFEKWPDEPRLLNHLLAMAVLRPGSAWEEMFAESLKKHIGLLGADQPAIFIQYCFRISRPDLAWLAWQRLESLDPSHPALYLAAAQFGRDWLSFRRHYLQLPASTRGETASLAPFYGQTRNLWPLSELWRRVPLIADFTSGPVDAARTSYLDQCLAELARREREGSLEERAYALYPTALKLAGRYEEAHTKLDALIARFPRKSKEFSFEHILLYGLERKWDRAYEAAYRYSSEEHDQDLAALIVMIDALMHLDRGMHALAIARSARKTFPESPQLSTTIAAILQAYGFKEEALFLLETIPGSRSNPSVAELLFDTQRFADARALAAAVDRIDLFDLPSAGVQGLLLPPAELALMPQWPPAMSDDEMKAAGERYEATSASAFSPYLKGIAGLSAQWCRMRGDSGASDPAAWAAVGRDPLEKAAALYELAMLLARQGSFEAADTVCTEALGFIPDNQLLWKMRITLSRGNPDVVSEAILNCPNDSEIWLASMAVRTIEEQTENWAVVEAQRVVAENLMPIGTLIRAGDFLWRAGEIKAAAALADHAVRHARGMLPAYVLGLRCALALDDFEWALACAMEGSQHALDASPFHNAIVAIKDLMDVHALEQLHARAARNPETAERLGTAYFKRGNLQSVFEVLAPLLADEQVWLQSGAFLIGAEAERLQGRGPRALTILEKAYADHPYNINVVNNLTYELAQTESTLPRALELLPTLMKAKDKSYSILDTISVVHLKAGNLNAARQYADAALSLVRRGDYAWSEVQLNSAEIDFRLERYEPALRAIKAVLADPRGSPAVEQRALILQKALSTAQSEE